MTVLLLLRRLWEFVAFWRPLDATYDPQSADRRRQRDHSLDDLASLAAPNVERFVHIWERSYDEIHADIEGAQTRAANLVLTLGVLSGLIALAVPVASTLSGHVVWSVPILLVAVGILYCVVATFLLAIRAQGVGPWSLIVVEPNDFKEDQNGNVVYAVQLYWATSDNRSRFRNTVGYLRWAYQYATTLLVLLVVELAALLTEATGLLPQIPAVHVSIQNPGSSAMEALIALGSAVVGGVVVGLVDWMLQRAAFKREDRAAVRTVFSELSGDYLLLTAMRISGFKDPSLLSRSAWDREQSHLATLVPPTDYDVVQQAYVGLSALRLLIEVAKNKGQDFFKEYGDLVSGTEGDIESAMKLLAKHVGTSAELTTLQDRWKSGLEQSQKPKS